MTAKGHTVVATAPYCTECRVFYNIFQREVSSPTQAPLVRGVFLVLQRSNEVGVLRDRLRDPRFQIGLAPDT